MLQEINELYKTIAFLNKKVEALTKLVDSQQKKIDDLEKENSIYKERLSKYEVVKNSNNSSIPPSKDENRPKRNQSLREKTRRKPGGQKGRKGNTLKMVENPDIIEKHIPEYCNCCGKYIKDIPYKFKGKRQVIDIPEIRYTTTEHQIYESECSCGHITRSMYPTQANAHVSYGNNIESLIGYFYSRQYIPFKRLQELLNDVFQIPISEGGIHYLLKKIVKKAEPVYQKIKENLQSNKIYSIGADETGMKINGEKHWAWTWQNEQATFITISDNRGGETIKNTFEKGFPNSVLVHDCWRSHFNTPALTHQLCTSHLLRDLNYLTEKYNHKWSNVFKLLLLSGIELKKGLIDKDYLYPISKRNIILSRLKFLLDYPIDKEFKELLTFQKRMKKYEDFIFTFLFHQKVPPDNNGSERAIRNTKVKQKISGQFKSEEGGKNFVILRSITDTVIKNKQNVLNSLKFIANLCTD